MGKLTVKQILVTLEGQLLYGKTYLSIGSALREAGPTVTGTAPTFFGLMSEGGFVMAQMSLARLYDHHTGTVTISLLLDKAKRDPGAFRYSTKVAEAVKDARAKVTSIASVLDAIRHRRNTSFAHIDPRAVNDPVTHQAKAELTIAQLQSAFRKTESIIQRFGNLFDGVIGPIRFLGGDDYIHLFRLIRQSHANELARFDRAFEEQFGHSAPKR